jgi:MoxR-like ATPase
VEDRVTYLDNDGTMWCERPSYVQLDFFVDALKQRTRENPSLADQAGSGDWDQTKTDVFSEEFLLTRPLLTAIRRTEPTVLLIDETDKADIEIEGLLLEVLSDFAVTVPELGTIIAERKPFVVLTSNATRELSEALKRRCLFLHIDFPDARLVKTIIESHAHPEQGYRSCLGILRLEKHYPKERLENAALRALRYSNLSLKALRKSWRTDSTVWKKKTLAQQPYCRPMTTSVAANITTDQ